MAVKNNNIIKFQSNSKLSCIKLTWERPALDERVSCTSTRTIANWIMVDDTAFGVRSAGTRTRILTLLIDTGQRLLALGIRL